MGSWRAFRDGGNLDGERAAASGGALNPHGAVVRLDDRLHDTKAEPTTSGRSGESLVGLIKPAKHALALARREADAVVFDSEPNTAIARLGSQDDAFFVAGILPGI